MSEKVVEIQTNQGNIVVKLYDGTPQHRDNFLKLVNDKYYEGVIFHRVIKEFMIQTGDPQSKNPVAGKQYGTGGPDYTIEAEINPKYIHKKGALAAARTGDPMNPQRRSSGSQFYIVQGKPVSEEELNQMDKQADMAQKNAFLQQYLSNPDNIDTISKLQDMHGAGKMEEVNKMLEEIIAREYKGAPATPYTEEQKKEYAAAGGTPFLDRQYTVFGEVIEGLDIVDKIASTATQPGDRPKEDILVLKMKVLN